MFLVYVCVLKKYRVTPCLPTSAMIMHDQVRIQVLHAITWAITGRSWQKTYRAISRAHLKPGKNQMEAKNSLTQCNMDYTVKSRMWSCFTPNNWNRCKCLEIRLDFLFPFVTITFFFYKKFWYIVELQSCVNFCCTATWSSYIYRYILFHILLYSGLSQDVE